MADLIVVGGGLAGSEAAWQAAQAGLQVDLYEMRPERPTGAHVSSHLAELICSNSLGSALVDRASGLLQEETRRLGSLLVECARQTAIPAGNALAVDRDAFSTLVTDRITSHPRIRLIREEITAIPEQPTVIASGPLTSDALSKSIQEWSGEDQLFFFDAIAPIVQADTINMTIAFRASRYRWKEEGFTGDYINCPLEEDDYHRFLDALLSAERIPLREFEQPIQSGVQAGAGEFFERCLPVEVLAGRSPKALTFGPMRPVGLSNPRTGRRPFAVVQLRQENQSGTLYNLVGFQTNLTYPEQKRVLRLIPGLEQAEFARYGQMHRNTFIMSPRLLRPSLQSIPRQDLFFAGQITGVEGYMGNIATGLLAGVNASRVVKGLPAFVLPVDTMLGALCEYITQSDPRLFQPMKAIYGILPPLEQPSPSRRERAHQFTNRALHALHGWMQTSAFSLQQGAE